LGRYKKINLNISNRVMLQEIYKKSKFASF
jgi:hypothetical protein